MLTSYYTEDELIRESIAIKLLAKLSSRGPEINSEYKPKSCAGYVSITLSSKSIICSELISRSFAII